MDEKEFKSLASRLEQVARVLEKVPPEVRGDAFNLFKEYVTDQSTESTLKKKDTKGKRGSEDGSEEGFFGAFDHDKPADNVKLIAAYFYREYGVEPFSVDEIRQKADDVGITIPSRVDMTLRATKEKGKKLFASAGRGKFKPTVHGETNLKTLYSVTKGTKKREGAAE